MNSNQRERENNCPSLLEVIVEDEDEAYAHHRHGSTDDESIDMTMDIKALSITKGNPFQKDCERQEIVLPQKHQDPTVATSNHDNLKFIGEREEEEGKQATLKAITGVMADAMGQAVDMVLKEGQITSLGDDSLFTMAAIDTRFFE